MSLRYTDHERACDLRTSALLLTLCALAFLLAGFVSLIFGYGPGVAWGLGVAFVLCLAGSWVGGQAHRVEMRAYRYTD